MSKETWSKQDHQPKLTIVRGGERKIPPLIYNILHDTSPPTLVYLSEKYGLRRIPGLSQVDVVNRLLKELPDEQIKQFADDLIAFRYGGFTVEQLLDALLKSTTDRCSTMNMPRVNDMSPDSIVMLEGEPGFWKFSMHGYDVTVSSNKRNLACDCHYFRFSAKHQILCKHLARALTLIPESYARKILIDLLITTEYGGPETPQWGFYNPKAA